MAIIVGEAKKSPLLNIWRPNVCLILTEHEIKTESMPRGDKLTEQV